MRGSYSGRNRAFEVVEYFLYLFAVIWYVKDTYSLKLPENSDQWFGLFLIACAFVLALFRNYTVMQSIDRDEKTQSESYAFVEVQTPGWDFLERLVRIALITLVIFAPRYGYVPLSNFMSRIITQIGEWAESAIALILTGFGAEPHFHNTHTDFQTILIYNGAVLLSVAVLSMLWDLTGILSFKQRYRPTQPTVMADVNHPELVEPVYKSILMYINILKVRLDEGKTKEFFLFVRHAESTERQITHGQVGKLYWKSPKFWERLFLTLFSLQVIVSALTKFSTLSVYLMGGFFGLYLVAAAQNQRYIRDFGRTLFFPVWYFIPQGTVRPWLQKLWGADTGAIPAEGSDGRVSAASNNKILPTNLDSEKG